MIRSTKGRINKSKNRLKNDWKIEKSKKNINTNFYMTILDLLCVLNCKKFEINRATLTCLNNQSNLSFRD